MERNNYMNHHDVFISYSSADKALADAVCAYLESHQIRCWYAPRDVHPGSTWAESIINAITASKVMVLLFSSHSNDSLQVLREIERAASKGLPIVPFRIENLPPAPAFEFFLSVPHWLDAFPPPADKHFQKLLDAVTRFLSSSPPSAKQQVKDKLRDGIPESDQRILDTMSIFLSLFGSDYDKATLEKKEQIEKEVGEQLSGLKAKWKMTPKIFELYIKICLEEKRVLHNLEFIRNCVEYIERHREYGSDAAIWLAQNAVG